MTAPTRSRLTASPRTRLVAAAGVVGLIAGLVVAVCLRLLTRTNVVTSRGGYVPQAYSNRAYASAVAISYQAVAPPSWIQHLLIGGGVGLAVGLVLGFLLLTVGPRSRRTGLIRPAQ